MINMNGKEDAQERSLTEIDKMLHLAKMNPNDFFSTSQSLHFANGNVASNNYKLLELDSHLLQTLNEGDIIYIKGDLDENAVICTESRTYDVTEAETSNSLLLVENLKFTDELKSQTEENRTVTKVTVNGIFHDYLEVSPSKPHFQKLYVLLERSLYKGPEYESDLAQENLLSYEDLLQRIQASRKELDAALETMFIIKINNKIRKLDFEYHFRILSYMLDLIEENSWALDEIDYDETVNSLNNLAPMEVLDCLFDLYTEKSKIIDSLQLYKYKETEVCKFFAQVLLSHAKKFNYAEFLQAWRESVPNGMIPREEMLYGIAVVTKNSVPYAIRAFQEDKLPENIMDRFKALFEVKEKWTVPEITPYIQRLANEKTDVSALLAKYARASTLSGVKYYSAKHAK